MDDANDDDVNNADANDDDVNSNDVNDADDADGDNDDVGSVDASADQVPPPLLLRLKGSTLLLKSLSESNKESACALASSMS